MGLDLMASSDFSSTRPSGCWMTSVIEPLSDDLGIWNWELRIEQAPPQKLSPPRLGNILPLLDDHLAARQHGLCHAAHPDAFVAGVIDIHVMRLRGKRHLLFRIEDHDVGVGADGDGSLPRKE